jgi:glyoxylase-like metal-dependent hydrolase (beta-lactamase superfamily II)
MYELNQLGENTFYINCPAKIGLYRLENNEVILIDSGNDKEAGKKILKIISENNWTLKYIINTHSNADHIGGNRYLSDATGCKIYTTKLEGAFTEFPILEPSFLYGGYPFQKLHNKFLYADSSIAHDINEIKLPDGFEYFSLKGHFFDMIGIKTPDDICFMADSVVGENIINKYHISFLYDISNYLSTLDMIETMHTKLFVPAHAEVTDNMRELVKINKDKIYEIIENIKKICKVPTAFEDILQSLFNNYNLVMDITQYVLVGSTIRSYLSYMLDMNMLKVEFLNNKMLWSIS